MTKQEFNQAQKIQEQIKDYQDLRSMTLKPHLKFGRNRLLITTHESNMIYIADPELNDLVRQYTERRIKELEAEFKKIGEPTDMKGT